MSSLASVPRFPRAVVDPADPGATFAARLPPERASAGPSAGQPADVAAGEQPESALSPERASAGPSGAEPAPARAPAGKSAPVSVPERASGNPSAAARLALAKLRRDLPGASRLPPTGSELAALEHVLGGPRADSRARVLLALREAGLPLGLGPRPDSGRNLEAVVDMAEAAWRGTLPAVTGRDPLARLTDLAALAARAATVDASGARRMDAAALQRLRAIARPAPGALEPTGRLPDLVGRPARIRPELVAPGGATVPRRRITGELSSATQAATGRVLAPDLMVGEPGQQSEPFTHQGVAERIDGWTRGLGTRHEDRILTLLYGLDVADRVEIGVRFARLRAARGESPWKELVARLDAAAGETDPAARRAALDAARRAAYATFADLVTGELDDLPFRHSADGLLVRAALDLDNPTGEPLAADLLRVDLAGLSGNGEAVLRLLDRSSPAALAAIDDDLARRHGTSLAEAVGSLPAAQEREARFLLRVERQGGRVPPEARTAFDVREAALRGDWPPVFRWLEGADEADLRGVAVAFARTFDDGGRGGTGAEGNPVDSALFAFLAGRAPAPEVRRRLELEMAWYPPAGDGDQAAVRVAGGRYVRDPDAPADVESARETLFRQKSALYVAYAAGDTAVVLGQVKGAGESPEDGRPTVADVHAAYRRLATPDDRAGDGRLLHDSAFDVVDPDLAFLADVQKVGGRAHPVLAALVRGDPLGPAQRIALTVARALGAGRLDDAYAALDASPSELAALSTEQREAFAAGRRQLMAEVEHAYGPPGALRRDLARAGGGERVEVPGGATVPARALALLDKGFLTDPERVMYAIHAPAAGERVGLVVLQALARLHGDPAAKVAFSEAYAALTGRASELAAGGENPVVADLRGRPELGVAPLGFELLPGDERNLVVPASGGAGGGASAAASALADGSATAPPSSPAHLAEVVAGVEGGVTATRGHALASVLMDLFGSEGKALDSFARTFGTAVRDYAALLASGAAPERLADAGARVGAAFDELVARTAQYDRLRGARAESVRDVAWGIGLTAALVLAPQASPALLAALGGGIGGGVGVAFDEPASSAIRSSVRGAALGGLAGLGVAGMRAAGPAASAWQRGTRAAVAASGVGAGNRAVSATVDPLTWRVEGGPGAKALRAGRTVLGAALDPVSVGADFAAGYAVSLGADLVQRVRGRGARGATGVEGGSEGSGQTGGSTGGSGSSGSTGGTGGSGGSGASPLDWGSGGMAVPPTDATSPLPGGGLPAGVAAPAPPADAVLPATGGGLPAGSRP